MPNLTLPEDLTEPILVRLPVKSLVGFKCVCKSWLSLISDPKFAKSHYDLATQPTYRFLFISTSGSQVRSIDIEASLDDHSSLSNHILPRSISANQFDDSILIYGYCRGFLLFEYGQQHRDLLVWNPSTGVHRPIPYPHSNFMYQSLYGFWYDESTDDYLVLFMIIPDSPDWKTDIDIFSLKTNSWDKIEGFKFPYTMTRARTEAGLLLNGALHWLVYSYYYDCVIFAFDLIGRSSFEIPLPYSIAMEGIHLRVVGDYLCLCYPGGRAMAEIWMMKEYKVHSSWTKSYVLPTDNIPRNFFFPMCFTKSEGLFGSNCSGSLVKFNSKGVLTEHRECENRIFIENLMQSALYRESLLSLPGDFGELSDYGQQ